MFLRKILLFIIGYITLGFSLVFAGVDIDFSVNKQKININDNLVLNITVSNDDVDNYNIEDIPGLENFDITGQSKSTSYKSDGKTTDIINNITILLKPKESGSFILGPLKVRINEELKDYGEEKNIEVSGTKLFIGDTPNITSQSTDKTPKDEVEKNNISDTETGIVVSSEDEKNNEQNQDIENMVDIYDIKKNLFSLPFNLVWSIYYILFFLVSYYLYSRYRKIIEDKKTIKQKNLKPNIKVIDYKKLLSRIENNFLEGKKHIFYAKLGEVLRIYMDDKVQNGLSTKTLSEIKDMIDENLYDLLKRVYYPEYDNKIDSEKMRKDLLKQIGDIIINK